jgi:hypothetical protein
MRQVKRVDLDYGLAYADRIANVLEPSPDRHIRDARDFRHFGVQSRPIRSPSSAQ